ncbi:hypothetical protein B484DRAFT_183240 [Ochromonadaceae sp. CCMP2298]|nr:hypothetical protein B484DRAFT_183240 [Ochromonadaceae sp. CCMP2298]
MFKSHKWISAGEGQALQVEDVQGVFAPVARNPCNIISIFGRARQGKSFLMVSVKRSSPVPPLRPRSALTTASFPRLLPPQNCLAGEKEIFRISNMKESCTMGIDVSDKWLPWSDFSNMDGAQPPRKTAARGMQVGFVDAEGQGDKDVSYDANLICPILLMSKCVLFNWKGDLQKDHILSTLGIMARAAKNVSAETHAGSAGGGKKFGHLHIVFRDWQAVGTDEADVYSALLGMEGSPEAATRDVIRRDLLSSFESIRVWLFDPPSELTRDLREKLVFDRTSLAFRAQVRALRLALAEQLSTPTLFAGSGLAGRSYLPLTRQIAASLNSGQAVLPSSAYLTILREEAVALLRQFEKELAARVGELLQRLRAAVPEVGTLFPTSGEAQQQYQEAAESVRAAFQAKMQEINGGATGGPAGTISAEFGADVQRALGSGAEQVGNNSILVNSITV